MSDSTNPPPPFDAAQLPPPPPVGPPPAWGSLPRAPFPPTILSGTYPPAPTSAPRRNGLAVAALVLGIVSIIAFVVVIPPILAIVFGLVAASQIKRSNGAQVGLGMARAGWILGILTLGAAVAVYAVVIIEDQGKVSVDDLAVGDCVKELPSGDRIVDVEVVGCSTPHEGEVYLLGTLNPDGDRTYPGDAPLTAEVERACLDGFEPYVGKRYDQSVFELFYTYPVRLNWKGSRGSYQCMVTAPSGTSSESARNSGR